MIPIKQIPNLITAGRIVFSLFLFLVRPLSLYFFIIYLLCGASDILDGYIARKMKSNSPFGATLDSIADLIFITVLLTLFIPFFRWPLWILGWVGIIGAIRLASLAVGYVKYRTVAFLHTYANKFTGLLLFCFPFLYNTLGLTITAFLLCGIATLSAAEELAIQITSKKLSRDIRCIFEHNVF